MSNKTFEQTAIQHRGSKRGVFTNRHQVFLQRAAAAQLNVGQMKEGIGSDMNKRYQAIKH
jgi:hypothetical protein